MTFRFIHSADIHLDSPMRGLSSYEHAPVERLRTATREALSALIDAAIEEAVDFVVFAGDIFDGDWRDMGTGLHFAKEMGRLNARSIPAFLLKGNHDAESAITANVPWPENVHVFDTRPSSFQLDDINVALHGQSFKDKSVTKNLAAGYPPPVAGYFNIGVLHTALEGYTAHATYAPCRLDELCNQGMDYWALGHVHEYEVLHDQNPVVLFPGNLQGRSVRETGDKGAVLVTVSGDEVTHERLIYDIVRWHQVSIDASQASTLADLDSEIRIALQDVLDSNDEALHAVRIVLTGATAAHHELVVERAHLRDRALSIALGLTEDDLWIEKVEIETTPDFSLEQIKAQEGALSEFAALFETIGKRPEFLDDVRGDLERLLNASDKQAIDECPELQAIRAGKITKLVEAAIPDLTARLRGGA